MAYEADIDCVECANFNDHSICCECSNNPFFENYYTPMSPETKAKREAEERKKMLSKIPKVEAPIDLTPKFKQALGKAWSITPDAKNEDYSLLFVYCGDCFVMATDTFRLVKIKVNVSEQLIGKYVIFDHQDEGKLYIHLDRNVGNSFNFHEKAQKILDDTKGTEFKSDKSSLPVKDVGEDLKIPEAVRKYCPKFVSFKENITLNKSLLDGLLQIFPDKEEMTITYKGPLDAVRFATNDIEGIILPVKTER